MDRDVKQVNKFAWPCFAQDNHGLHNKLILGT